MDSNSPLRLGLRWGLALGGFLVLYGLVFRLASFHYTSPWTWIFYIALPVGATFAMRAASRAVSPISFKRLVGTGAITVILGSAIYCVFVYGYNGFIDDSLLRDVRADQTAALAARSLDPESYAAALENVEAFTEPGAFSAAVFLQLSLVGVLASLIPAAIHRRKSRGPAS